MIRPVTELASRRVETAPRPRHKRSVKKYDVLRMMAAVREGGLEIASVEIAVDGTIRLASAPATPERPKDEFERWEDRL